MKYVNTLFSEIEELNPPEGVNGGGFDNGVVVVNRLNSGEKWYTLGSPPTIVINEKASDIIESHWSNWLAQDEFLQDDVNNRWIAYYKTIQTLPNRYIAKNSEQFYSQWLYKKYTRVTETKSGHVEIDNSMMPTEYYDHNLLGNMVLKLGLNEGEHVTMATINNEPIACYFEEAGYGYIYMPMLDQEKYILNYKVSDERILPGVFNDGTYNVYRVTDNHEGRTVELRVYGLQKVHILCSNPQSIEVSNPDLQVVKSVYHQEKGILTITLKAHDIQGETGLLKLYQ